MLGIYTLILPPQIMHEGKQSHHFGVRACALGKAQTVFQHPLPVTAPVQAPQRQSIIPSGSGYQFFIQDSVHGALAAPVLTDSRFQIPKKSSLARSPCSLKTPRR
jgi:hypothetical protein